MKQDIDRLMRERGLAAMVTMWKLNGNPSLFYMTNGAKIIRGHVIQKVGSPPLFLCAPIDREEAAASGLDTLTLNDFDYETILAQTPDLLSAQVELLRRVFERLGVQGRVGFYGAMEQNMSWELLNAIRERIPGIEVCGEYERSILDVARATKDDVEAGHIRETGRRTEWVFARTVEYMQQHAVRDEMLVKPDGVPLTVGDMHREIMRLLGEQDLDVPEGIIFAQGRDAGVPHNKGTLSEPMHLGRSIIFDMGTRDIHNGYYYDMTRTFSLGYATDEVQQAYEDVKHTILSVMAAYEVGASVRRYQSMAYDILESRGHPTTRTDSRGYSGFITGLGHGIGLAVHEDPFFTDKESNPFVLTPGQIFTCEPGVYYPDRGFGVRIEDVTWIDAQGGIHNTTSFPKELVVKVKS